VPCGIVAGLDAEDAKWFSGDDGELGNSWIRSKGVLLWNALGG